MFPGRALLNTSYHKLAQTDTVISNSSPTTSMLSIDDEGIMSSENICSTATMSSCPDASPPMLSLREEDYDWGKQGIHSDSFGGTH